MFSPHSPIQYYTILHAGYNQWGELGLGDKNDRGDEPGEMGENLDFVDLGEGVNVTAVALGDWHS